MNFNILASCPRAQEKKAASELWYILNSELNDDKAECYLTKISGLIKVKTSLNPKEVIFYLKKIVEENPFYLRYVLKLTPIEKVVSTNVEDIVKCAIMLATKINENETYRITVNKRHTQIHSSELIRKIASQINRKVNLENPNKILLIEIVGEQTGISVIKPNDILSIAKLRLRI